MRQVLITQGLPKDADSIIAEQKLQKYFNGEIGVPAILVFHNEDGSNIRRFKTD